MLYYIHTCFNFLNSEPPSCADTFKVALEYLQAAANIHLLTDVRFHITIHAWDLAVDMLGWDLAKGVESGTHNAETDNLKADITDFVQALPAVSSVLEKSKTKLCGSQ